MKKFDHLKHILCLVAFDDDRCKSISTAACLPYPCCQYDPHNLQLLDKLAPSIAQQCVHAHLHCGRMGQVRAKILSINKPINKFQEFQQTIVNLVPKAKQNHKICAKQQEKETLCVQIVRKILCREFVNMIVKSSAMAI